ncbi:hypothetical protein P3T27_006628 [Kitasatospora sp. MAA19]|nr:hypothetical protein [Kitasatospora sp. MAA19]MDH6709879.1 hypothetical protein [Kitasatospora sp. MAA19]
MLATFAAVFITLYAGHQVGDHWVNAAPAVSSHSRVPVEVAR